MSCLVLHTQHKSAGATLENVLKHAPGHLLPSPHQAPYPPNRGWWKCDSFGWVDGLGRCRPGWRPSNQTSFGASCGGYMLSLATHPDFQRPRCFWFTVFREPFARLVSAYTYCSMDVSADPLCANVVLSARNSSLEIWAEHWGNFLLRELMLHPDLSPIPLTNLWQQAATACNNSSLGGILYSPSEAICTRLRAGRKHAPWKDPEGAVPVWFQQRLAMQGADDPRTAVGASAVQRVKETLRAPRGLFDAVGVVERWNASMAVLDALHPPRGRTLSSWVSLANQFRVEHFARSQEDPEAQARKAALLRHAQSSVRIRDALQGDLTLYHEAVLPRFEQEQVNLVKMLAKE